MFSWKTVYIVKGAKRGLPFFDLARPARLPNLTAPEFFHCGYFKSRVYANKPQIIAAFKEIF